jgi:AcrR family transcriptional regulator
MFSERGFGATTVNDITAQAGVSVRTFYRYLPTKEQVLRVRIERNACNLQAALSSRPFAEPPMQSIRLAFESTATSERPERVQQWISVVATTPGLTQSVLGWIHVLIQPVIADFLCARLQTAESSLRPTMLAAAVGGVVQEAHSHWFRHGGDLAETISIGLCALEEGFTSDRTSSTQRSR